MTALDATAHKKESCSRLKNAKTMVHTVKLCSDCDVEGPEEEDMMQ